MSDNEMKNAILDDAKLDAVSGGANNRGEGDRVWRCQSCMQWGYFETEIPRNCSRCNGTNITELRGARG